MQKQGSKNLLNVSVQSVHHVNYELHFITLFYFQELCVFCVSLKDIKKWQLSDELSPVPREADPRVKEWTSSTWLCSIFRTELLISLRAS